MILALGTWSSPVTIDGAGNPASVSCGSASDCVVVDDTGHAVTWDGASWSSPKSIDPHHRFVAVSCPRETFCVAADADGRILIRK
jgi:hypothetical protein